MKIALIYDFDGTLSPGNMQEYDFIPAVGKKNEEFWRRSTEIAQANDADPILTYLYEMIKNAQNSDLSLRREAFVSSGAKVELFAGVLEWFDRVNAYSAERGVDVEHYINSSGLREMIEGTPIARYFKKIYACSFLYSVDGVAVWPAVAVNYTNKTQYIFKINKGITAISDDKLINRFVPDINRPMPFRNMIYIGDGTTDIPCMRLVKEKGGTSIAVYNPLSDISGSTVQLLLEDGRVNFAAPADYREGERLDTIVKRVVDKLVAEHNLEIL